MKQRLIASPSQLIVVLSLFIMCFTGSICDPSSAVDELGPCGENGYWSASLNRDQFRWIAGFDGAGKRVITLLSKAPEASDMCPDEHVRVEFGAHFTPGPSSEEIKAYGVSSWSLWGRNSLLSGTTRRSHVEDIGLKQAFQSDSGYVTTYFEFVFPSQGGAEIDSAYLRDRLEMALIEVYYDKFKAPLK